MNAQNALETTGDTAIDTGGSVASIDLATATPKAIAREARRLRDAAHKSMERLCKFTEAIGDAGRAELVPYAEHEVEEADLWAVGSEEPSRDMRKHNKRVPKSIVEAFDTVSDYFSE